MREREREGGREGGRERDRKGENENNQSLSSQLTPAESREFNKECTLLDFFDNHDIWHFLSAFGMFFAFMVSNSIL